MRQKNNRMKILVTGANGMLGQDLCPILEDNGFEVFKTDIHNLDIIDIESCEKTISEIQPQFVIHCAAYTNVDKAEEELDIARKINVQGTENIAKICSKYNIKLVYISTDYIFDGKKTTPYTTHDKPNPINHYGLTKLQGENIIKNICQKFYIIRTSWLYGHHGKNFVETMLSMKDNEEIKVVNDQIGCPTWTVELANAIIETIKNKSYGTYQICGSGVASWYDFAKEIFEQEGLKVNLKPCSSEEYPRLAKRPKYSAMANNNSCRDWKFALGDYLKSRLEKES